MGTSMSRLNDSFYFPAAKSATGAIKPMESRLLLEDSLFLIVNRMHNPGKQANVDLFINHPNEEFVKATSGICVHG